MHFIQDIKELKLLREFLVINSYTIYIRKLKKKNFPIDSLRVQVVRK